MSETRCPLGRQDLRGPASRSRGLAERFRIRIRPWGSGTRACGPSVRGTPPPAAPGLGPARNQRARRGSRGRSGAPGADRAAVRGSATAWGRRSAASGPGRRGGAGGSAGPGAPDGCALAGRERRAPAGDAAGALSPRARRPAPASLPRPRQPERSGPVRPALLQASARGRGGGRARAEGGLGRWRRGARPASVLPGRGEPAASAPAAQPSGARAPGLSFLFLLFFSGAFKHFYREKRKTKFQNGRGQQQEKVQLGGCLC